MDFGTLLGFLVPIAVEILIVTPIVWLAGKIVIGKGAALSRAFLIALLAVIFYPLFINLGDIGIDGFGLISIIALILVWIGLFKFFYNCSWLKALVTATLSGVIIAVILEILGVIISSMLGPAPSLVLSPIITRAQHSSFSVA